MKTPKKSLYSRLALATSVTLVVGYFVVYAVYENIDSTEVALNATITSTLMGKIKNNLDTLNTQVTDLTATVVALSIWSKVGSDINYTAGKVGVGATTGNAELDIQSGTKPHWGIYHDETSEELRFWNGDNRVIIGSTGNVGIGINPVSKLQVSGTTTSTAFQIYPISARPSASSPELYQPVDGHLGIATNDAERMRIDANGNVGIGTTTPGAKLEVVGKAYIGGYSIGVGGGDYPAHGYNLDWSAASDSVTGVKYRLSDSATAIREQGNFQFFTAPAGTAGNTMTLTERMRITNDGKVGIGTTAPSMKLEVNGGSLMVKDHTTGNPSVYLDIAPSIGVRIYATYNAACTTVSTLGQQIGTASSGRYLCWAPY